MASVPSAPALPNLDACRAFVTEGLCWQRVAAPTPATVGPALSWALELAALGQGLPPVGFVADLGHALFNPDTMRPGRSEVGEVAGLPADLVRLYEDHVLGRLLTDATFTRAADALRRYEGERDRARGLAYVLQQWAARTEYHGPAVNPAWLKALAREPGAVLLREGREALQARGSSETVRRSYEELVRATRRGGEMLGPEDLFELEHGTALAPFGQRLALRQVVQAADLLQRELPHYRPKPPAGRHDVRTNIHAEDTYPVGGFSSLSTRGSIESLLHSQLAYMEKGERPDLFDVKFLRDELLYYARDENAFLRRRRTFALVLYPDLADARFKDPALPYQRVILLLGLLVALIGRLRDWLSTEALQFRVYFPRVGSAPALDGERELLTLLLEEGLRDGTVTLDDAPAPQAVARRCALDARRSLCHCLLAGMQPHDLRPDGAAVTRLVLADAHPRLYQGDADLLPDTPDDAWHGWVRCLTTLLGLWL